MFHENWHYVTSVCMCGWVFIVLSFFFLYLSFFFCCLSIKKMAFPHFFHHYFLSCFVEDVCVCVAVEQSNIIVLTDCPICLDYYFSYSLFSFFFFFLSLPSKIFSEHFLYCVSTLVHLHPSLLEGTGHCTPNWDYVV